MIHCLKTQWLLFWVVGGAILVQACEKLPEEDPIIVYDQDIIFVQINSQVGAFQLLQQIRDPETVNYRWFQLHFDKESSEVLTLTSGTRSASHELEIPGFRLGWSGRTDGSGYLYSGWYPGGRAYPAGVQVQVFSDEKLGHSRSDGSVNRWIRKTFDQQEQ